MAQAAQYAFAKVFPSKEKLHKIMMVCGESIVQVCHRLLTPLTNQYTTHLPLIFYFFSFVFFFWLLLVFFFIG